MFKSMTINQPHFLELHLEFFPGHLDPVFDTSPALSNCESPANVPGALNSHADSHSKF